MPSFSKNKKAYFDYEILETFECGIVLNGDEVKSIRNSQAQLKGSYVTIESEQAYIKEAHISRYKFSSRKDYNPTQKRKILLHKKEISKIESKLNTDGITCIPLELYSKGGLIKLKIGLGRGKKLHDKRESLKKKSQNRDIAREIKSY